MLFKTKLLKEVYFYAFIHIYFKSHLCLRVFSQGWLIDFLFVLITFSFYYLSLCMKYHYNSIHRHPVF